MKITTTTTVRVEHDAGGDPEPFVVSVEHVRKMGDNPRFVPMEVARNGVDVCNDIDQIIEVRYGRQEAFS